MRKSDFDALTPGQQWRLRIALDRVMPPFSPPRYQAWRTSVVRTWRFAPMTLALALTGVLAMSAYAATGSANPAVWGQRAESTIQSVRLAPAPVVTGPSSPQPHAASVPGTSAKSASPSSRSSETPDGDEHDWHRQPEGSPQPSGSNHDWNPPNPSPGPWPSPSPSPSPSPWPTPAPSPSPSPNHGD